MLIQNCDSLTLNALKNILQAHGVDSDNWGKSPGTKPLESLLKEINSNECLLRSNRDGLVRGVSVASVIVKYNAGSKNLILQESHAVWKDGRGTRKRTLHGSLSEKVQFGEPVQQAAARGLQEELGLCTSNEELQSRLRLQQVSFEDGDSPSYPGLYSVILNTIFTLRLKEGEFVSTGYREDGPDKTTYFVWDEDLKSPFFLQNHSPEGLAH